MKNDRNRLYAILLIACLAGYIWLYFSMTSLITENISVEVCLLKHTTNIPCPSCGSTRSIIAMMKGDFVDAFELNPLGYIVALIMIFAPIWIIKDVMLGSNSLFLCYRQIESHLRKPKYAVPLTMLVLINWIWNIAKGL